jgi:hypothetical protein
MAFSSFFRLLFGAQLHPRAVDYLPESARPALPEPRSVGDKPEKGEEAPGKPEKGEEAQGKTEKGDEKPAANKPAPRPERRSGNVAEHHRDGALALLALLQREGRLVDFLREDLDDYDDEDIGASVRDIHRGCRKVLDEHLDLEPVMPGEEDEDVNVPKGFDPGEIRLVGDVAGDPPFKGVMRHHGWRVTKAKLPTLSDGVDRHVLAPAEVEIS